jgi:hypothetical protein
MKRSRPSRYVPKPLKPRAIRHPDLDTESPYYSVRHVDDWGEYWFADDLIRILGIPREVFFQKIYLDAILKCRARLSTKHRADIHFQLLPGQDSLNPRHRISFMGCHLIVYSKLLDGMNEADYPGLAESKAHARVFFARSIRQRKRRSPELKGKQLAEQANKFLSENVIADPSGSMTSRALIDRWIAWCQERSMVCYMGKKEGIGKGRGKGLGIAYYFRLAHPEAVTTGKVKMEGGQKLTRYIGARFVDNPPQYEGRKKAKARDKWKHE